MGLNPSKEEGWELPSDKHEATIYYFAGRGLADQIRWMLAATNVPFTQKVISQRDHLVRMTNQGQLPFGQLPLLQIDGLELVQSQAIIRYLARRSGLQGKIAEDVTKCDMIAETVRDLLSLVTAAPFKRNYGSESDQLAKDIEASHIKSMISKWSFVGERFEAILRSNKRQNQNLQGSGMVNSNSTINDKSKKADVTVASLFLVGDSLTYADVLVAHITTWYVEECGAGIVANMPLLVQLQNSIIAMPGIRSFIKSVNYFPRGDKAYVEQVKRVLDREI